MTVLWLIGALVLVLAAALVIQLRAARSYLVRPIPPHRPLDRDEALPAGLVSLMEPTLTELEALGFGSRQWVFAPSSLESDVDQPDLECFLAHPDGIWAEVHFAPLPNVRRPVTVTLLSWLPDDRLLMTLNHREHALWPPLVQTDVLDVRVTIAEHVAVHRDRIERGDPPSLEWVLKQLDDLNHQSLRHASSIKHLSPAQGGFRPTWAGALDMLRAGQTQASSARRRESSEASPPIPAGMALAFGDTLERYYRRRRPARPRRNSWALMVASMVLAGASFALFVPFWQVVLFTGVLLLHELGHLAAMRATGHSETTVFFLPFFGAATVGRKKDSSSAERVFVALMGPLPGLMLAALALPWILDGTLLDHQWVTFGWAVLVAVNWLNLVPMLPLDGGHVLNMLVFSRAPHLETAFRVLSLAVVLALGLWFDLTLLVLLFAAGAIAVVGQHRVSLLATDMWRTPPASESDRFRAYARHLIARYGHSLQFPTALALVEATELRRNQRPLPWKATLLFATVYGIALIAPPLAWWMVLYA